MPESTEATSEIMSQYAGQVARDLERNTTEQTRITAELTALQEQLTALQQDHTVLVNVQQALGLSPTPKGPTDGPGGAPAATSSAKVSDQAGTAKRAQPKKTATSPAGTTGKKPTSKKPTDKAPARPTLVALIRDHLTHQNEPRSAAEITTALEKAHPERGIKNTVVRTTLEGLVAKYQAQRSKQGSSVYYTAPHTPQQQPQQTTASDQGKTPSQHTN